MSDTTIYLPCCLTRLIRLQGLSYLVKWEGYHVQESTWEPEKHLPVEVLRAFLSPPVSTDRLAYAARNIENAFQQRLSSKSSCVTVSFDLDVFRYVFGSETSVVIESENDMDKLPLCCNWSYKLNKNGKGLRVSFPLRVSPKLFTRRVFVRKDEKLEKLSMPIEKVCITCAIEPYI